MEDKAKTAQSADSLGSLGGPSTSLSVKPPPFVQSPVNSIGSIDVTAKFNFQKNLNFSELGTTNSTFDVRHTTPTFCALGENTDTVRAGDEHTYQDDDDDQNWTVKGI